VEQKPNLNLDLKLALLESGFSQRHLAWGSGVHENIISKIIRGYREPTEKEKQKISDFLLKAIEPKNLK